MSTQNILLCISENYINYSICFIKNIIAFNRQDLNFYILYSFNMKEAELLQKYAEINQLENINIVVKHLDTELRQKYEHVSDPQQLQNAYNLRLYASLLNIKGKLLYLDLDIICLDNITELFNLDMQGKTIAAVPDSFLMIRNILSNGSYFKNTIKSPLANLDYTDKKHFYFNSGVILIYCDQLAKNNIWLEKLDQLQEFKKFPDQTYLNYLHYDDCVYLSNRYNYLAYHLINNRAYLLKKKWYTNINELVISSKANQNIDTNSYLTISNSNNSSSNTADDKHSATTLFTNDINLHWLNQISKANIPTFLHFAGKQKPWNSSAAEFKTFYSLFLKPIDQVIKISELQYKELVVSIFKEFGYSEIMTDYNQILSLDFNLKQLKLLNKKAIHSYNPIFINAKLFESNSLTEKLSNITFTNYRKNLNKQVYQYVIKTSNPFKNF